MADTPGGVLEVRCRCGQVYRADPAHAGRSIRCRCGRTVPIRAPRQAVSARLGALRRFVPRIRPLRFRRPANRLERWLDRLAVLYLLVALLAWVILWRLGDVWWPVTVVLFGPRWLLIVPAVALLPLAVIRRRRLVMVGLAVWIVLGPVMGLRLGSRNWLGAPRPSLRVATYNVDGGKDVSLSTVLLNLKPDIVAFQECGSRLAQGVAAADGWYSNMGHSLCLLSRFPITHVDSLASWRIDGYGFSGAVLDYTIRLSDRDVHIVNLHLETPRKGLEPFRAGGGTEAMAINTELRDIASARARRWVDSIPGSPIVLGDFNTPVESRIYQRSWGDLTNAFSQAGFGFGGSRVLRWFRIRIDHILFHDDWRAVDAFLGPDMGSDHLPMVADLAWTGAR